MVSLDDHLLTRWMLLCVCRKYWIWKENEVFRVTQLMAPDTHWSSVDEMKVKGFSFWKPKVSCPEQYFNKSICQKPLAVALKPLVYVQRHSQTFYCHFSFFAPVYFSSHWYIQNLWPGVMHHFPVHTTTLFMCYSDMLPVHFLLLCWEVH